MSWGSCLISETAHEPVLNGEERYAGAVAHLGLGVDVLEMVTDGLAADREPVGDLLDPGPASDQCEHLHLTRGQAGGADRPRSRPMPRRAEYGVDRGRVEAPRSDLG